MAYPVIGQPLQLEITDGYFIGRYNARVQDFEKTKIFIDMPLKTDAKHPTQLPSGQSVLIRYRAADGAQCSFITQVVGREVRQIPLLALQKPAFSEIHRMQRREFLRVPLNTPVDLVFVDTVTKQIVVAKAHGHDISGGGVAFRVKKELSIQANDIIGFTFRLPLEGQGHEIVGKARVIRINQAQDDWKVVSLKFFEVKEQDRQRIIQYSFKRQIEMREKGVLG